MAVLVVFWGYLLQFFVKKCAKMVVAALVQFRFVNWQPQATRLRWSQRMVVVGFRGPAQYFLKKFVNLLGGTLGEFGSNDVFWMMKSRENQKFTKFGQKYSLYGSYTSSETTGVYLKLF